MPFIDMSIMRADLLPSSTSNTSAYQPCDPNEIIGLEGYNYAMFGVGNCSHIFMMEMNIQNIMC